MSLMHGFDDQVLTFIDAADAKQSEEPGKECSSSVEVSSPQPRRSTHQVRIVDREGRGGGFENGPSEA